MHFIQQAYFYRLVFIIVKSSIHFIRGGGGGGGGGGLRGVEFEGYLKWFSGSQRSYVGRCLKFNVPIRGAVV